MTLPHPFPPSADAPTQAFTPQALVGAHARARQAQKSGQKMSSASYEDAVNVPNPKVLTDARLAELLAMSVMNGRPSKFTVIEDNEHQNGIALMRQYLSNALQEVRSVIFYDFETVIRLPRFHPRMGRFLTRVTQLNHPPLMHLACLLGRPRNKKAIVMIDSLNDFLETYHVELHLFAGVLEKFNAALVGIWHNRAPAAKPEDNFQHEMLRNGLRKLSTMHISCQPYDVRLLRTMELALPKLPNSTKYDLQVLGNYVRDRCTGWGLNPAKDMILNMTYRHPTHSTTHRASIFYAKPEDFETELVCQRHEEFPGASGLYLTSRFAPYETYPITKVFLTPPSDLPPRKTRPANMVTNAPSSPPATNMVPSVSFSLSLNQRQREAREMAPYPFTDAQIEEMEE